MVAAAAAFLILSFFFFLFDFESEPPLVVCSRSYSVLYSAKACLLRSLIY